VEEKLIKSAQSIVKTSKTVKEIGILWFVDKYQGTVIAHPAKFTKEDILGWELLPIQHSETNNQLCQNLSKASWRKFTCRQKAEAFRIRVIDAEIRELMASKQDDSFEQALMAIPCAYPMVN
jgi:hypothetical protein